MKPYYDHAGITIYHGDCREVLPSVAADAVVTDPPYGTSLYATDTDALTPELLAGLMGIGPTAIFGWPERLVARCVQLQVVPDEWITWAPTNGGCRGFNLGGLWRDTEHIAVFGAGRWERVRRPRSEANTRIVEAKYVGVKDRLGPGRLVEARAGDVWRDPAPGLAFQSHLRQHPNEKPIPVLGRLVEALSERAETILDPFMGSGTTLRAAKDLGRKAIGVEIEERYCEIAAQRLGQEVMDFGEAA